MNDARFVVTKGSNGVARALFSRRVVLLVAARMSVSAAPSSAFLPLHKPRCAVAAPTRGSPNARSFTVTPWNVRCCDASPCGNVCRAATVTSRHRSGREWSPRTFRAANASREVLRRSSDSIALECDRGSLSPRPEPAASSTHSSMSTPALVVEPTRERRVRHERAGRENTKVDARSIARTEPLVGRGEGASRRRGAAGVPVFVPVVGEPYARPQSSSPFLGNDLHQSVGARAE